MSVTHTVLLTLASLACSLSQDLSPAAPAAPASAALAQPTPRKQDDFAALEHHLTHTLAHHYLWPWRQLFEAAASFDIQEAFEEPKIISTKERFQVKLSVKRYRPDELKVRVKNRHLVVEGKQRAAPDSHKFALNHFVQQFLLPPGTQPEEVTASLKDNVLTVSAPKHEVPPPPPEREVPIEVLQSEVTTTSSTTAAPSSTPPATDSTTAAASTSSEAPAPAVTVTGSSAEQLDTAENTTHVGKIRKKELKTAVKSTKDNEVEKGLDNNGLEYAPVDAE